MVLKGNREIPGLVITDRDGTLIRDVPYLSRMEDIAFLPGVPESLRELNERGIPVCVATNQSGVARGFFSESFVREAHDHMNVLLKDKGARIDLFLFCPHLPEGSIPSYSRECDCRKPRPGLILKALRHFGINAENAMMVGDAPRDMEAAQIAGIRGYFMGGSPLTDANNVMIVRSFSEAVEHYLSTIDSLISGRSPHAC